jgi:hypothetical protein
VRTLSAILVSILLLLPSAAASSKQSYRCSYVSYSSNLNQNNMQAIVPGHHQLFFPENKMTETVDSTGEWSVTNPELEWRWNPTEPDRSVDSKKFVATAVISFTFTVSGELVVQWRKNDAVQQPYGLKQTNYAAGSWEILVTSPLSLAPGDYIQLYASSSVSTGNLTVQAFTIMVEQASCTRVY